MVSIGRFDPGPDDTVVAIEDGPFEYRKLVVDAAGRLAGAVVLGRPHDARLAMAAVLRAAPVDDTAASLRAGDWSSLEGAGASVGAAAS